MGRATKRVLDAGCERGVEVEIVVIRGWLLLKRPENLTTTTASQRPQRIRRIA